MSAVNFGAESVHRIGYGQLRKFRNKNRGLLTSNSAETKKDALGSGSRPSS